MGIGYFSFTPAGYYHKVAADFSLYPHIFRSLKVAATDFSTIHSRIILNISRNRFINNYFVLDFCLAISILLTKILTDEKYLDKRPEARHRGYRLFCTQKEGDQAV